MKDFLQAKLKDLATPALMGQVHAWNYEAKNLNEKNLSAFSSARVREIEILREKVGIGCDVLSERAASLHLEVVCESKAPHRRKGAYWMDDEELGKKVEEADRIHKFIAKVR
jgi:hypothetical protein